MGIHYICVQCGVQYTESESTPKQCPICEDERQFVNWDGQKWTTLEELSKDYNNVFTKLEDGLTSIQTEPSFAIGQHALLVETSDGNILWDCTSLIDDDSFNAIDQRGGLKAIAISHPHFYASMVEWSKMFGYVPIYLHTADRQWIMRPENMIEFWEGDNLNLFGGLTIIHCSGHFSGSSVLHWPDGSAGRGVLLSGDTLYVTADRNHVTFMRSFPNLIPLSGTASNRIVDAVKEYDFDRIYSGFPGRILMQDAKSTVQRSLDRYIHAINSEFV